MRYSRFEPLDRDLSLLVLGTRRFFEDSEREAFELLDAWVEAGGNAIDTGREYGRWGESETVIGRWLEARGRPDGFTILTKGGHHRNGRRRLAPEDITADLHGSLSALGVECIDLYLLHRDDTSSRIGPVVEALNEHARAGRFRAFGASNWTTARIEEAKAYADVRRLTSFSCSSPGLSLAEQVVPPWEGCVGAHDVASLEWYTRTQLPVFAWSALAGGFFAGRTESAVKRSYESARNHERLRRARELAEAKGCTAPQIALAWVLHQPFPTFAVIGPANVTELYESVAAVDLELSPAERPWLDLEESV